jgi:hypothetical protein
MKRCLFLLLVAFPTAAPAQEKDKEKDKAETPFVFPDDLTGKKLAEMLQPGRPTDQKTMRTSPLGRKLLAALENPEPPPPTLHLEPRRLLLPTTKVKAPRPLPEDRPLARYLGDPHTPALVEFPIKPLWRWDTADVNLPQPLPLLATPSLDRASLADPSTESSRAAALGEVTVGRTAQVPFAPVNLPDPFELRQSLRYPNSVPENPNPAIVLPRLPEKTK